MKLIIYRWYKDSLHINSSGWLVPRPANLRPWLDVSCGPYLQLKCPTSYHLLRLPTWIDVKWANSVSRLYDKKPKGLIARGFPPNQPYNSIMKKGDGKVIVTPFRAQIKLNSQAECAPISLDIPFLIRVGLYIHPAGHMLRSLISSSWPMSNDKFISNCRGG